MIYVVTWYDSTNCGTCLQARALYEVIGNRYPVKMVSYYRKYSISSVHDIRIIMGKLKKKLDGFFTVSTNSLSIDDVRRKRIKSFVSNSFDLVDVPAGKARKEFEEQAECFIVGSDQLWNPFWLDELYYLDFVSNPNKKKSYATSIGLAEIPPQFGAKMRKRLATFSSISVRENQAKQILSELLGRKDINIVCDPTLLLTGEDWRRIYKEVDFSPLKEPYILCYFVGGISGHEDKIRIIQKKLGMKIVLIPMQNQDRSFINAELVEAGPYEFLHLIDSAEYVCTDSFHAIAISIAFHKQFSVLERKITAYGSSQKGRIVEILDKYGLSDRIYVTSNPVQEKILYEKIDGIIYYERETSMNILFDMIGKVK